MKNYADYITIDPRVCHGKMVYLVFDLLEAGVAAEEITGPEYYPQLTKKHIEAALHYASDLLKTREYVPEAAALR